MSTQTSSKPNNTPNSNRNTQSASGMTPVGANANSRRSKLVKEFLSNEPEKKKKMGIFSKFSKPSKPVMPKSAMKKPPDAVVLDLKPLDDPKPKPPKRRGVQVMVGHKGEKPKHIQDAQVRSRNIALLSVGCLGFLISALALGLEWVDNSFDVFDACDENPMRCRAVEALCWVNLIVTAVLITILAEYYISWAGRRMKAWRLASLSTAFFQTNLIWYFSIEFLVCIITPIPVPMGSGGKRFLTKMGLFQFARLYVLLRVIRDHSSIYKRRAEIINSNPKYQISRPNFGCYFSVKNLFINYTMEFSALLLLLCISILAFSAHVLEREVNETLKSLADAMWFMCVTAGTIGYGDVIVRTTIGRILAIIGGWTGVILTSLIAAVVANKFQPNSVERYAVQWIRIARTKESIKTAAASYIAVWWKRTAYHTLSESQFYRASRNHLKELRTRKLELMQYEMDMQAYSLFEAPAPTKDNKKGGSGGGGTLSRSASMMSIAHSAGTVGGLSRDASMMVLARMVNVNMPGGVGVGSSALGHDKDKLAAALHANFPPSSPENNQSQAQGKARFAGGDQKAAPAAKPFVRRRSGSLHPKARLGANFSLSSASSDESEGGESDLTSLSVTIVPVTTASWENRQINPDPINLISDAQPIARVEIADIQDTEKRIFSPATPPRQIPDPSAAISAQSPNINQKELEKIWSEIGEARKRAAELCGGLQSLLAFIQTQEECLCGLLQNCNKNENENAKTENL